MGLGMMLSEAASYDQSAEEAGGGTGALVQNRCARRRVRKSVWCVYVCGGCVRACVLAACVRACVRACVVYTHGVFAQPPLAPAHPAPNDCCSPKVAYRPPFP